MRPACQRSKDKSLRVRRSWWQSSRRCRPPDQIVWNCLPAVVSQQTCHSGIDTANLTALRLHVKDYCSTTTAGQ